MSILSVLYSWRLNYTLFHTYKLIEDFTILIYCVNKTFKISCTIYIVHESGKIVYVLLQPIILPHTILEHCCVCFLLNSNLSIFEN